MTKRLIFLPLLLSSAAILLAQNSILPIFSIEREIFPASALTILIQSINDKLQTPRQLVQGIPAEVSDAWCPLETVSCPGRQTKYVVVVTLDGFRWQEMFRGADSLLLHKTASKPGKSHLTEQFWAESQDKRRAALMPFIWNNLATHGQIFGNRDLGSPVDVANKICISYPGYSEIFTGYADDGHIYTNFKIKNRNSNVLDFINQRQGFRNRVASFASWDVFPSIFNEKRNRFFVNAAFEPIDDAAFFSLNQQLQKVHKHWGNRVRPDSLTFQYGMKFLETHTPRVLHIGFGETDEYAHDKEYDHYLQAAHASDRMIGELWQYLQNHPKYHNKTTLIVTTDHGRGNRADTWNKHHGLVEGSGEIWIAMIGPDTAPAGEMRHTTPLKQQQLAQTIAQALGLKFECEHPVAAGIAIPQ